MAWLEIHQSLPTHRKTLALADALGIEPVHAVGHLTCLWLWTLDNAPEGALMDVSSRTIARAAQWRKDADAFVAALVDAGFLDADHYVHDWEDYAGRIVERRRKDAERKRLERGHEPDVPPPSNGQPADIHGTSDASRARRTQPNRTQPDRTVPKRTGAGGPHAPVGAPPRGSPRVKSVIDCFRAMTGEPEPAFNGRDFAAIKHSTAPPHLIAETYLAVAAGDWGDDFQKRRLSVHEACDWVNAYVKWRDDNDVQPIIPQHDPLTFAWLPAEDQTVGYWEVLDGIRAAV